MVPGKQNPAPEMDDTRRWLTEDCFGLHTVTQKMRRTWINNQHQFNAMFNLPEALWG